MSINQKRIQQMQARLNQAFSPTKLDIIDDSQKHRGHPGAQSGAGHFHVVIAAAVFQDKTLLQAHRMIYAVLQDMMNTDIHALNISIEHC